VSNVLHRDLKAQLDTAVSGAGVFIRTASGREIIDGSGGAAVSCLGHGHPEVIRAIQAQTARLSYVHSSFFTNEPAEELAHFLVGGKPGGLSHVYFTSGGSEATEAAIKLARQYFLECHQPQRQRFIARRQSFHGNTLGALTAGGNEWRRAPYVALLSNAFSHVSPAFAYRFQLPHETLTEYCQRLIAEIEAEFQRLGPDTVAAFIAEPVVGATAGAVTAPPGYFSAVREICDRHGALLILDEVMCGVGRTGTLHAWQQEDTRPDIQMVAKGLGGGYQPIGAVLAAEQVVKALEAGSGGFVHGHTYQAHPIACAAALAVQRVIQSEGLLDSVRQLGEQLNTRLRERFSEHAHVGDIRGRGLLQAIELVADRPTRLPFAAQLKVHARIKAEALRRGLACYPMGGTIDGASGDHVLLAPPYIAKPAHIDQIVDILGSAVDAVTSEVTSAR